MNLIILIIAIALLSAIISVLKPDRTPFGSEHLPYRRKDYLLTVAERSFYEVLRKIADTEGYLLFAKVRLEDLLWIPAHTNNRFGLRNRIKSRHIDFVLCDRQNVRPLVAVELDDSSHRRADRIERDRILDRIFSDAGLPLFRIPVAGQYSPIDLSERIRILSAK